MDKYEYNLKLDQMKSLFAEGKYAEAAELADSINWNKVRNVNALVKAGEAYEKAERYTESRDILLMAYDRSPIGRTIIYRLAEVAVKMKDFDGAQQFYNEFVEIAPHDNLKYVLKYNIQKAQGASIDALIPILEEFKEQEYTEEWAFELASLYHQAGKIDKCIEACDELILWFGDGPYVESALELKMLYQPLTKIQEDKYRKFRQEKAGVVEIDELSMEAAGEYAHAPVVIPEVSYNAGKFNTMNLQEEIAKGMQQIMQATEKETVSDTIDNIKKIVEDIPYLQQSSDSVQQLELEQLATDRAIDSSLKSNFQEFLQEESDGQISLVVDDHAEVDSQIEGQMTIQDILDEWEKTRKAAEAALYEAEQQKLESAKAIALQQAGDIMDKLNDVIPKLDAGVTPKELLEEEYLQGTGVNLASPSIGSGVPVAGANVIPGVGIDPIPEFEAPEMETPEIEAEQMPEYAEEEAPEIETPEIEAEQMPEYAEEETPEIETSEVEAEQMPEYAEEEAPEIETSEVEAEQMPEYAEEAAPEVEAEQMPEYAEEETLEAESEISVVEFEKLPEDEATDELSEAESEISVVEFEKLPEIGDTEEFSEDSTEVEEVILPEVDIEAIPEIELQVEELDQMENLEIQETNTEEPGQMVELKIPEAEQTEEQAEVMLSEPINETWDMVELEAEIDEMKELDLDNISGAAPEETPELAEEQAMEVGPEIEPVPVPVQEMKEAEEVVVKSISITPSRITVPREANPEEEARLDDMLVNANPAKKVDMSTTKRMPSRKELESYSKHNTGKMPEVSMPEDLGSEESKPAKKVNKLTEEQKAIFSYFVPVKGMEDQLCKAVNSATSHLSKEDTVGTANLIIQGERGCGKTVLATSFIQVVQQSGGHPAGKIGKIDSKALNNKDVQQLFRKISGGCLIIESAGELERTTAAALALLMSHDRNKTMIILEDTSEGIKKALSLSDEFTKQFTDKISVPIFTNDELVAFARSYSNELGYKIDEMAVLALYNRISNIQRLDQATTLTEIKEIVDEAIEREAHGGLRKAFSILTAKRYTEDDKIVLNESNFEIK